MNCQTCKASCVWAGKEQSEHGKCLVGYVPKTNADRIRSMTDEELADVIAEGFCSAVGLGKCDNYKRCTDCALDWLKEEVTHEQTNI